MLRVVAYALVVALLPRQVRGWGYGVLSTASATGILVGVAAAVMAARVLPPDRPDRDRAAGMDILGAGLVLVGVVVCLAAAYLAHRSGRARSRMAEPSTAR